MIAETELAEIRKRAEAASWYGGTATRDVYALLEEVTRLRTALEYIGRGHNPNATYARHAKPL